MSTRTAATLSALLIAAPTLLGGLASLVLEGGRTIRPDDPLFAPPAARSLEAAIISGDVEAAYAFIRAGQDPHTPLTAVVPGSEVRVTSLTPLMLAVAARQPNVVLMLLGQGVSMENPDNGLALCLALELGDEELAAILARAFPSPPQCPDHVLPGLPAAGGGDRIRNEPRPSGSGPR